MTESEIVCSSEISGLKTSFISEAELSYSAISFSSINGKYSLLSEIILSSSECIFGNSFTECTANADKSALVSKITDDNTAAHNRLIIFINTIIRLYIIKTY